MATFKFGRTVDIHWNGYDIQGPAETVFSIPDQLYEEFDGDIAPVEPTLVWLDTNEFQTLQNSVSESLTLVGSTPINISVNSNTSTISINSGTNPNGYLLAANGSGGVIFTPASTSGLTSVVGISPISTVISGNTVSVSIDQTALSASDATTATTLRTYVKNSSGSTISKGQVVYITGADGTNALIGLASNTSDASSSKTLGIAASTMTNNAFGYVIENGQLSNIDTSAATAGDAVWLGSTPGSYQFTVPAEPNHAVYLGVVTKANVSTGEILVKVQNGYELDELHDVSAGSPSDLDIIQYKSSSNLWTKASISNAGIAASVHTHNYQNAGTYVSSIVGTSPISASGTTAITLSIRSASTSADGSVQLTDSTSSTSTTTAATPKSVKSAYDLANAALPVDTFGIYAFGSSAIIATLPRFVLSATITNTTGTVYHTLMVAHKNFTVSSISFNAVVASNTLTLVRFGIYTRSGTTFTLVARTASDTTIFTTVNTKYTRALDTAGGYPATYDLIAGQEYWISVITVGNSSGSILGGLARTATAANNSTGVQVYTDAGEVDLPASSTGAANTTFGGLYAEVS